MNGKLKEKKGINGQAIEAIRAREKYGEEYGRGENDRERFDGGDDLERRVQMDHLRHVVKGWKGFSQFLSMGRSDRVDDGSDNEGFICLFGRRKGDKWEEKVF